MAGQGRGDWATPRAKQVLRDAVLQLTHGKCVFCESRLGVASWVEVEHYHPKRQYPDRAFEWANLFPACAICNQRKWEQDHQGALLKPDEEDPERYFWVHPDTGSLDPAPGLNPEEEVRAAETVRICDLQRDALRAERAELVGRLSQCLARGGDSADLVEFLDPRFEYKLVVRHMFERSGYGPLADLDRRLFQD